MPLFPCGLVGATMGGLGCAFGVWALVRTGGNFAVLSRYRARLCRDLAFVGGPSGSALLAGQAFAVISILACAWVASAMAPLALIVPALAGPHFALLRARALRTRALESQLDGWLTALSNTLVATSSLPQALTSSSALVQNPLRQELERVAAHVSLGVPLDRALLTFGKRARSPVVSSALLALRVARNAGGELRPMLESAAQALRDMARFEGMVRAKTSEGKAQALAVSIVPAPLILSIKALSPEFFAPLGESKVGLLVVAGSAALWILAIVLAAKITAVDV